MTEEELVEIPNNFIPALHGIPANNVFPANAGIQLVSNDTTKQPAVYPLSRERNGTLYVSVIRTLPARIWKISFATKNR